MLAPSGFDSALGRAPFDPGPTVRYDRRRRPAWRRFVLGVAVSSAMVAVPGLASLRDAVFNSAGTSSQVAAVGSASPTRAVVRTRPAHKPDKPRSRRARLVNGRAIAPAGAPAAVRSAIAAANRIAHKPYDYGGGHASFESAGYDCSGAVSYALHGAGLLGSPLPSGALMSWGKPGPGRWITVYAHGGHAYAVIAGLRWDTSGDASGDGPRWHADQISSSAYTARHIGRF
jgi:hypothetical protein